MLIRSLKRVLKLLQWQRLDFLLNQILKLLSYVLVDFSIFSGLVQRLMTGSIRSSKHNVICIAVLIVLVCEHLLGLCQTAA